MEHSREHPRRAYGAVHWLPCRLSGVAMTYEDAATLFDLMEAYREEHPEATDEECFEAVIWGHHKFLPAEQKRTRNDHPPQLHR